MKVHCSVHSSLKLVSVLCQISLDQAIPGCDFNIHVKFIHHCHLDQQVVFYLQTHNQKFTCGSLLPHVSC